MHLRVTCHITCTWLPLLRVVASRKQMRFQGSVVLYKRTAWTLRLLRAVVGLALSDRSAVPAEVADDEEMAAEHHRSDH